MLMKPAVMVVLASLAASGAGAEEKGQDPFFPADRPVTAPARTAERREWARDPFEHPLGGVKKTAGVSRQREAPSGGALTGIICGPDVHDRFAIVGGEVLRIGGKVGTRTITDIRRKGIVLKGPSGDTEEMVLEDFTAGK